jgi:hypothetical protein
LSQQANDVDVEPDTVSRKLANAGATPVAQECWAVAIRNNSRRPIRNVAGRIKISADSQFQLADQACVANDKEPFRLEDGKSVDLVRAGSRAGFGFAYTTREFPRADIAVRFTDDAGLHWQIDHDLHLSPIKQRDW